MDNLVFKSQRGNVVTDSLLVAEKFEKEHKNVLRDIDLLIEKFGSSDLSRQYFYKSEFENRGKKYPKYIISKDGFSLLVMGYTGQLAFDFKIKFIEAFNKMEDVLKSIQIPQSFAEALQLAANQAKQIEQQQSQLEEQKPKVLFADSVSTSEKSILISELAKILKQNGISIGQNRLFEKLRFENYLLTKGEYYNKPSQKAMELGLFEIKETVINKPNGKILLQTTTKVTGKGQIYFVNKFVNMSIS